MRVIDTLQIIDGYFDGNRFIMRGLAGYAVFDAYTNEELLSFAREIDNGYEALYFTIDNDKHIELMLTQSKQLQSELIALANELETY